MLAIIPMIGTGAPRDPYRPDVPEDYPDPVVVLPGRDPVTGAQLTTECLILIPDAAVLPAKAQQIQAGLVRSALVDRGLASMESRLADLQARLRRRVV